MKTRFGKRVSAGTLALLIAVCFMPAVAVAFGPGEGRPAKDFGQHGHQRPVFGIWRNPQMIEKLKLTDAQVIQLRDLDFAHREKELPLKATIETYRLKMDKAISADSVDNKTVLTLAQKIADVRGKLFIQKMKTRLAVKEILTDDQINELKQLFRPQRKRGPRPGQNCLPNGYAGEKQGPANF